MEEIERRIDKFLSPERAIRWLVRIVMLIVVFAAAGTVLRVAMHMTNKVEAATTDHSWFVAQRDAIEATELEIQAAREALERHQAEVAGRSGLLSVSHSSDRNESARLNRSILGAQTKRIELIRSYNEYASEAPAAVLTDLPKHIELSSTSNQ